MPICTLTPRQGWHLAAGSTGCTRQEIHLPRIPPANRLIATLPSKDRQRFVDDCDLVALVFGEILSRPGERIRHVYFPMASVISLVTPKGDRATLEVGLIGNEGMLGSSLMLGVDASPLHALVQAAGPSLRISAARFQLQFEQSAALKQRLNRYLHVQMTQLAQLALCTRFHVVEARLARWLLMTQDRTRSDQFHATHELVASLLGVRRVGVTKAASSLQENKLISYRRGHVSVLDRVGLEAAACVCYEADKAAYAQVLGSWHY